MSAPRFAARLLSLPGFADEAEYRLGEAAEQAALLHQRITDAIARVGQGASPKHAAFELVAEHPAIQTLAAFAEVGDADRAFLHTALETPDSVRAAVEPLIALLDTSPRLLLGLGEAIPGLSEVRLIGPRFDVDLGRFFELLALDEAALEQLPFGDRWIELPGEPPPELSEVWYHYEETLMEALARALGEFRCLPLTPPEHPRRLRVGIERDIVLRPRRASLLAQLTSYISAALRAGGMQSAAISAVVDALPAYFAYALFRGSVAKSPDAFWDALKASDGMLPPDRAGAGQARRLQAAVRRPVLGQRFALCQIYVSPRGALDATPSAASRQTWPHSAPTIVDVHRALDRWVDAAAPNDAIRVVSGAPGAGKSSLARMYAAECSRRAGTTVYIPLHSFDLDGDLRDAIRAACDFDPFDAARAPLLLILDGLDEFALRGPTAASGVGQLVDAVCRTAEALNQDRLALRAILLGRELVVQRISDRFRKPGQVIRLLPLKIEPSEYPDDADPDGVRDLDQRHDWWRRYGAATGEALDGIPPELDTRAFEPLTREPLLAMLLAIARQDGLLGDAEGEISLGELYRRLTRQVYERVHAAGGPQRLAAVADVEFADYEQFLWAIAEAAWHGAGRTATVDDVRRVASPRLIERLDALTRGSQDPVSRLMTAFYFREHRGAAAEQKTFEFTHQSFAEYLLACRLIDFMDLLDEEQRRYARGRGGWSPTDVASRWYGMFGPAPIEPHVVEFLRDAVARRGAVDAAAWQKHVEALIERVVEQGFPVERGERGMFVDETRRAGNAGSALLVMASVCAGVSRSHTRAPRAFERWLDSLLASRFGRAPHAAVARHHLDWIDWRDVGLSISSWVDRDLSDGRFDGCRFHLRRLIAVRMSGCSLSGAYLAGCDLVDVNLANASLEGARLTPTKFDFGPGQATLATALRVVRLHGANLAGAHLLDVVFENCTADSRTIWPDGFDPIAAGIEIEPD